MDIVHNVFPRIAYPPTSTDTAICNGSGPLLKGPIVASFALASVGQFALLVLITTLLLFAREERSVSTMSLLMTTLVGTLPPYLLIYGNSIWDPDALGASCVAQAYLLPGCPTLLATALWPMVLDGLVDSRIRPLKISTVKLYRTLLVVTPYITFVTFSFIAVLVDQMYPNPVRRPPGRFSLFIGQRSSSTLILFYSNRHIASQIVSVLALLTALCLEMYVLDRVVLRPRRCCSPEYWTSAPFVFSKAQAVQVIALVCLQAIVLVISALSNIAMLSPVLRITAMVMEASVAPVTSAITATRWRGRVVNVFKRRSDGTVPPKQSTIPSSPALQLEVKIIITVEVDLESDHPSFESHKKNDVQPRNNVV